MMDAPNQEHEVNELGPDSEFTRSDEVQDVTLLHGTYADILFVLLPFSVVALFRAWNQGFEQVLLSYDLAMAAGVLGGLAVVKFIMGIMIDPTMSRHREWIVFLVAGTVFLILAPGLMFSVMILLSDPVPQWVMFVQPLLVVLAIGAYSGAVTATHRMRNRNSNSP